MRRQFETTGVVLLSLGLVACGGGGNSPTTPTEPPPTPTSLHVATRETPEVGASTQLVLEARFSDGSVREVTAQTTWESLSIDVATVSAGGLLTGVAPGDVTIRATYGGQSQQRTLKVRGRSVEVTVRLGNLQCLQDCDTTLNGDGDFTYRAVVSVTEGDNLTRTSRTSQTAGYPSGTVLRLADGETHSIDQTYVFRVREEAGAYIEVEFRATELDLDNARDPRLNDRSATARFVWNATGGWGNAARPDHATTLGQSGCRIRLHYSVQIR
jgi:hypothetical protein